MAIPRVQSDERRSNERLYKFTERRIATSYFRETLNRPAGSGACRAFSRFRGHVLLQRQATLITVAGWLEP